MATKEEVIGLIDECLALIDTKQKQQRLGLIAQIDEFLAVVESRQRALGYDPGEARDEDGKWTSGGGSSSATGDGKPAKQSPTAPASSSPSRLRSKLQDLHATHERISARLAQTNQEAKARYDELSAALAKSAEAARSRQSLLPAETPPSLS